jgi:CheY-like chemotaxis protein
VQSELGAGTEFVLTLPACHEVRRKAAHQSTKPVGGAEKILIADDEPEMLKLLETVLKDLGYSVISATNGIEAVDYASDDIRLIILDMIMPEMDGVAALRAIRQKTPDVKVLVSSGYTSPEKAPILEALGIEGFVQKPFEVVKLAATVRDVLDGVTV